MDWLLLARMKFFSVIGSNQLIQSQDLLITQMILLKLLVQATKVELCGLNTPMLNWPLLLKELKAKNKPMMQVILTGNKLFKVLTVQRVLPSTPMEVKLTLLILSWKPSELTLLMQIPKPWQKLMTPKLLKLKEESITLKLPKEQAPSSEELCSIYQEILNLKLKERVKIGTPLLQTLKLTKEVLKNSDWMKMDNFSQEFWSILTRSMDSQMVLRLETKSLLDHGLIQTTWSAHMTTTSNGKP